MLITDTCTSTRVLYSGTVFMLNCMADHGCSHKNLEFVLWMRMCASNDIIPVTWALRTDNVSCLSSWAPFWEGCRSPLNLPSIRVMPRYDYDSIKCQEFASCTNSILLPRPPSSPSSTNHRTATGRPVVCSLFCLSFFNRFSFSIC